MEFTHLHLHTEYSLLDGFAKIDKVLDRCVEYGMKSVAITDHGVMFGVIDFYKKAKKRGIKPIIGCEIYLSEGSYLEKTPQNKKRYHLILLAENWIGYQNLIKIVSEGFINGYYYKPRVDKSVLKKYSEGIIALSACMSGEVQIHIRNNEIEFAKKSALEYKEIFGEDNFYLELQDHGLLEQKKINKYLKEFSKELEIPLVATNDVHYTDQEEAKIQDILMCISTGKTVDNLDRMRFPNSQFYFKSPKEMEKLFQDTPEALINTQVIAERCNVDFKFHDMHLPFFDIQENHEQYLRELVFSGLKNKYNELTENIINRANEELDIINKMGFTDYFLIVWDFIDYAKKQGIAVGPGRGSAAGSIVSYSLGITGLDPIKYDLLFERFLNPERVSMPDIDIDFDYERRNEVIEYVKEKYGESNVAQIVTFGTLAARNAIRDVGRVTSVNSDVVDKIAKQVPQEINMTIKKALNISEDFRKSYEASDENKKLIDTAMQIEGMPKNTSTHAAGVVIASKPLNEFVPLYIGDKSILTQYNMTELEELGLLKMDFLGLRTLTVISDSIKLVKYNKGIDIDIENIDLNDKEVLNIFNVAETIGVFQFESEGMRAFLKELKPTRFDDLIAANSLFRPGPMNEIPNYIRNRHNKELVTYLHPLLESILEPTYGTIVFQEQVMQIVQKLAGFSLGEADNLRRAMGKKKMKVMEENREYFIYGRIENGEISVPGCLRNGIDEDIANKIYDLMIDFAKYAFNKSHSAAYSFVAFQTAWLKVHYPEEFMASLLSSVMGSSDKVYLYIKEAKKMGIEILLPSVNSSYKNFSVEGRKIRIGLSVIKSLGVNIVEAIVNERKKGKFKDFDDFVERMVNNSEAKLNKKSLEYLIFSGAMDGFGLNRAQMVSICERAVERYSKSNNNIIGQEDIFSMINGNNFKIEVPKIPEFSKVEMLKKEKEYIGAYITDHPFSSYEKLVSNYVDFTTLDLIEEKVKYDKNVIFSGIIISVKAIFTKQNRKMCFIELEDIYGKIEAVVFPQIYEKYKEILIEDKAVLINGKLQINDNRAANIIINNIREINNEIFSQNSERNGIIYEDKVLYLKMKYSDKNIYSKIRNELLKYKGKSEVVIYFYDISKSVSLKNIKINLDLTLINSLVNLLGNDSVIIK